MVCASIAWRIQLLIRRNWVKLTPSVRRVPAHVGCVNCALMKCISPKACINSSFDISVSNHKFFRCNCLTFLWLKCICLNLSNIINIYSKEIIVFQIKSIRFFLRTISPWIKKRTYVKKITLCVHQKVFSITKNQVILENFDSMNQVAFAYFPWDITFLRYMLGNYRGSPIDSTILSHNTSKYTEHVSEQK